MIIPSTFCGLECDQFFRNSKFQPSTCRNVIYIGNVTRLQHHRWCNAELPNAGMLQPHVKNSSQSQFLILAFTWSTPCQYPNARDLKRQSAATMKVSHLISWCVVHCKGHCRVKQNASSHNPWKVKNNAVLMEQNSLQMYMVTLLLNYKLT